MATNKTSSNTPKVQQPAKEIAQSDDFELRKKIEEYYLPEQLITAVIRRGKIPEMSDESLIGVGFLDIVDYSYLSKFLTPRENHILLNGLYTVFQSILLKRGGYLNKIDGDSIMFHFGGILDPKIENLKGSEQLRHIACELFYACVEMQYACILFNHADETFFENQVPESQTDVLRDAFAIINTVRTNVELSSIIGALFQIRIRVGASIGEVMAGNFGPMGAKQWDIIGMPVIVAKRMEMTAPIGGFRISDTLYQVLYKYGYVNAYCEQMRLQARFFNASYQNIKNEEVFKFNRIVIKSKKNVAFDTYSVEVNSTLPNDINNQIRSLLLMSRAGAEKAVELILYHRGNHYIIDTIEEGLLTEGVNIRKDDLLRVIFPKKYNELVEEHSDKFTEVVNSQYSLYELFDKMGKYQDVIMTEPDSQFTDAFVGSYHENMEATQKTLTENYKAREFQVLHRAHFYNLMLPLVIGILTSCIIEHQETLKSQLDLPSALDGENIGELEEV